MARPQDGGLGWRWGGREQVPVVVDGEAAVEALVHHDARPRVAAAVGARSELEPVLLEAHGVVQSHRALVLEAAELVEGHTARDHVGEAAVGGGGLGGRDGEAGVEARQVRPQHTIPVVERTARVETGQAELGDEAVLERAEEPLDAPLGLWRERVDGADAQLLQDTSHLGRQWATGELLLKRPRLVPGVLPALEDAVPVDVDRQRHAFGLHHPAGLNHPAQPGHIASGVLLRTEQRPRYRARRVVNAGDERPLWPIRSQPAVRTAIRLEQLPLPRHALATRAVGGPPARARAPHPYAAAGLRR